MAKPIPGQQYTIVQGDTLSGISLRAYGIASKWPDIWKSNSTVLRSGDPNLIFPGEVIWVPDDHELQEVKTESFPELEISGKDPNDFTLVINGREVPVQSGTVTKTMDTLADGWTAVVAFDADDPAYDEFKPLFYPYQYQEAVVYLGGIRMVTGYLYSVNPSSGPDGRVITLEGWSKTADLVDSTIKSPFQASKVTLEERINEVIPAGIGVEFTATGDAQFDRVKAERTDTISDHILGLAKQRAIPVSSTATGQVLCEDVYSGAPVEELKEDTATGRNWSAKFDGRARWNTYRALGKSPRSRKAANAKDNGVRLPRLLAFNSDDTTAGNIADAAAYRRNRELANALSISIPVFSWYTPSGKLRKVNTTSTVTSPTLFLDDGFVLLTREIEYRFNQSGIDATLSMVPPSVYTKTDLDDPWSTE
jgi:prophage tail gpP-like protein